MVIALVLAIGSLSAEGGFRRYSLLKRDLASLEDRNAKLTAENTKLKREVQRLRSEPAALERAARESLGLVRSGEIVFNLEAP
ncbi:MAG TPA: septum formation initiator family protein [Archangium sp.]